MPYKKAKRQAKKAPYRKRRGGYRKKAKYQKAQITRMKGTGFADTVFAKLNYVESLNLSTSGPKLQVSYRANSLYDPDPLVGGHQPMYFDQYAAIYSRYRVVGCAIRIDMINAQGLSGCNFVMYPSTTNTASTTSSISLALEQARARNPKILPIAGGGPPARIKSYCSTRKALGLLKGQDSDDTLEATVGANPSSEWFWNLLWETSDSASNVAINGVLKLVYYVQFFDKIPGTQS